ncbi:FAD-binding oxidoreductase [Sphingomonas sp. ABOLF]|uniref:FAD-dependent oxidoreductase n=1 Tax=Sphingomonas sp. ABOLF TaxID=1985879 RepID=UPI000F7E262B|nr:FAD-dependent oxidoreductase [Sphingomonas sp. ABOLF]RSV12303.1 FAD-binding oxidoreductase [Sphingomonas sp. ABOLF]
MTTAVVIGGGFYGANVAVYLKRQRGVTRTILLERDRRLLTRSSFVNQARVHRGYHYPRSFTTAYRSVVNAPRFEQDFGSAVFSEFTKLYALARRNSKVTPRQMERFCAEIGAPISPAPAHLKALFNTTLIEQVYLTIEHAFDADVLRQVMLERLQAAGVEVLTEHEVDAVDLTEDKVRIRYHHAAGAGEIEAEVAFNCTYSRLQTVLGAGYPPLGLKHEISEMVLIETPPELSSLGVTVMDGPFFSTMPFPARGLHTLSHVRYTPHAYWREEGTVDPYDRLAGYHLESRADRMIRDSARYLPSLAKSRAHTSLFEVKTVLTRNEGDDGRPILLQRHDAQGRLFSILGGKIDNIYDILERLDTEPLPTDRNQTWTH